MQAVILGVGAVGSRAARQLASSVDVTQVVLCDPEPGLAEATARAVGPVARAAAWAPDLLKQTHVLVIAAPLSSVGLEPVEQAVRSGVPVVSVADSISDVEVLRALDRDAQGGGTTLVIGAGMAPGLTDVLACQAAVGFENVEEIHIAKCGTGGPACARQHHSALGDEALDWRDGSWTRRPGGSGRELCWFPDPVGGRDCYRAGLPDALLLVPAFPGVARVTARMAANRRDRLTSALPMLRRPHPEGEIGAVRVEVRGWRTGARHVSVLGAVDRPGGAAGAVAAVSALWAAAGRFERSGAAGLAELVGQPAAFVSELTRRGVKVSAFEGSAAPS